MPSPKADKHFTVIIIPHSTQETRSYRIPLWAVQAAVCLLISFVVLAGAFGYSYRKTLQKSALADKLININQIQEEQIYFLARETSELSQRMESLQELDASIRSLLNLQPSSVHVAGLGADSISTEDTSEEVLLNQLPEGLRVTITQARDNVQNVRESIGSTEENLRELRGTIEQQQERLAKTPTIWPVQGRITSGFGWRRSPFGFAREFHYGLDIGAPRGTPVYAAADGRVTYAGYLSTYGYFVKINHDYGVETAYAHLSKYVVRPGDQVIKGQVIGYVGNTGRSTGYHLHYEVRVNGIRVDPLKYLPSR